MKFDNVISLGVDCRVRFQISRYFEGRHAMPNKPAEDDGQTPAAILKGTHFFDWNVTWFWQVVRCLEAQFAGVLDIDTLKPLPNNPDAAVDGKYEFQFFHLFHTHEGLSFTQMVHEQFAGVQSKVHYLRDKLLKHLSAENPTIYVRCQATAVEGRRFCEVIHNTYPHHRFHLMIVEMGDETQGFTLHEEDFSIYTMASAVNKPPQAQWTGDDAEWSRFFEAIEALTDTPTPNHATFSL